MSEKLSAPLLFPCAARVKMPQFGSEDTELRLSRHRDSPSSAALKTAVSRPQTISKDYVQRVSLDLNFHEDVVKERCFHMLPYDEKYLYEALQLGDLIPRPPRTRAPVGRHNARGTDMRHMPCNLTKSTKPHLKPLKRKIMEKAIKMHQEAIEKQEQKKVESAREEEVKSGLSETQVFLTETKEEPEMIDGTHELKGPEPRISDYQWDRYLMSLLSSTTANWMVYERTPQSDAKEKLVDMLKDWYGTPEHTELIRDDISEGELEIDSPAEKKPKKLWKKRESSILERVYDHDVPSAPVGATDPYSDDNQAPFYRQPAGVRRARKHVEKEESGAINSTAREIKVKSYRPPPPPKLRDVFSPRVGDTLYDTDNMFQQERLTGTNQIHEKYGNQSKIVMESQNKYKKELQPEFPPSSEVWYPETGEEQKKQHKNEKQVKKFQRGLQRWRGLPQPIDDTAEVLSVVPPGQDSGGRRKTVDSRKKKVGKQNPSLIQIIGEWRSKWHLSGQYADSNPDDLIKDMADIQPHVRLKSIATVAKAAEYKPPEDPGIQLEFQEKQEDTIDQIPERIMVALECLLDDTDDKVKKAAAITLYSLSRPSEKASKILYEALESESDADKWAAAQCLAHFGDCDSDIVGEIIRQLLNTEDAVKHERAISMLSKLSVVSKLVHSLVAEQLNSSSWRHKVIACKILPTLHGSVNKDITHKLSDLMWNDWHEEVRRAAAQTLGKTGHGRAVHDDLRDRILQGDERIRLEAISKVGHLGIMTAKLLPAFLKCFDDEYMSVRSEVCITSGNLLIQDEQVLAKLIHLATFDPIWKVKALAIQALGKIGLVTEEIKDCLLWAVRYEEKPGVRAEACHSLMELKCKTEDVAEVLQDRFLVESSQMVREEIAEGLKMFGISATEDMDMVAQIKNEVRKLCTRNIIASQIAINESDEDRRQNLGRMIYESQKELEEHEVAKEPIMKRIRTMSQASSRGAGLPSSGSSSPAPSREGTVFTPTADKELEALMSREDTMGSDKMSGTGSTPGQKSKTPGEESDGESVKSKSKNRKEGEEESKSQAESEIGDKDLLEEEEEGEVTQKHDAKVKVTQPTPEKAELKSGEDRPLSGVKFSLEVEISDIPPRSKTSLTPGSEKLSRMSNLGLPSEMRALFSREALAEREKMVMEAKQHYAGLDARYKDMVPELEYLDNSYVISDVSRVGSHVAEKIQKVTVIQEPKKVSSVSVPPNVPADIAETDEELTIEDKNEKDNKLGSLPSSSEDRKKKESSLIPEASAYSSSLEERRKHEQPSALPGAPVYTSAAEKRKAATHTSQVSAVPGEAAYISAYEKRQEEHSQGHDHSTVDTMKRSDDKDTKPSTIPEQSDYRSALEKRAESENISSTSPVQGKDEKDESITEPSELRQGLSKEIKVTPSSEGDQVLDVSEDSNQKHANVSVPESSAYVSSSEKRKDKQVSEEAKIPEASGYISASEKRRDEGQTGKFDQEPAFTSATTSPKEAGDTKTVASIPDQFSYASASDERKNQIGEEKSVSVPVESGYRSAAEERKMTMDSVDSIEKRSVDQRRHEAGDKSSDIDTSSIPMVDSYSSAAEDRQSSAGTGDTAIPMASSYSSAAEDRQRTSATGDTSIPIASSYSSAAEDRQRSSATGDTAIPMASSYSSAAEDRQHTSATGDTSIPVASSYSSAAEDRQRSSATADTSVSVAASSSSAADVREQSSVPSASAYRSVADERKENY